VRVSVFRWSLLADRQGRFRWSLLADRQGRFRWSPVAFRLVQELLRGAGLGVQVVVAGRST